jgi:hypothetical protein
MTYKELTTDILAISRQQDVSSKSLILYSINQAISDIYSRRSILRTVRLFATGLQPTLYYKQLHCVGGSHITLPLNGRCYSMRISGEGLYEITDGAKVTRIEFDTGPESRLVRGFIQTGGQIVFYGHASFMIFDFSVYSESFSTMMKDIPDGIKRVVFDIRSLYSDFLAFHCPPKDGHGNIIEGARLFDGCLQVPSDYRGEIELTYRIRPPIVTGQNDDDLIDIPLEYHHLLALLSAYYYRIDEDEKTAILLKEEYERLFNLLDRESYEAMDVGYSVANRWA